MLQRELLSAWAEGRLLEAGSELSEKYPEYAAEIASFALALAREDTIMSLASDAFAPGLLDLRERSGISLRTLSRSLDLPKILFDKLESGGPVRGVGRKFTSRLADALSATPAEVEIALRSQPPQIAPEISMSMTQGSTPPVDSDQGFTFDHPRDFAELLREAGIPETRWSDLYTSEEPPH